MIRSLKNISMSTSSNLSPPSTPDDVEKLLNDLPKACVWDARDICQWEGFWFPPAFVKSTITLRSRFQARDDDVLLASTMKTGTTWLKELFLCIMQNKSHQNSHEHDDILTSGNPHFLIPITTVRSHQSCIVFDCFCSGVHPFGPFFEHVVEYWQESQKRPQKILFVKYEELKSDPKGQVSKIAEFLGKPFADEKKVDEVLWRCSLGRLKNLEVNKSGNFLKDVPNKSLFRKGEIGDWKNYLTPEMKEQINQICCIKLEPFGLFL